MWVQLAADGARTLSRLDNPSDLEFQRKILVGAVQSTGTSKLRRRYCQIFLFSVNFSVLDSRFIHVGYIYDINFSLKREF